MNLINLGTTLNTCTLLLGDNHGAFMVRHFIYRDEVKKIETSFTNEAEASVLFDSLIDHPA